MNKTIISNNQATNSKFFYKFHHGNFNLKIGHAGGFYFRGDQDQC